MSNPVSIFDLQAELCSAMSNSARIQIVNLLKQGPMRVNAISEKLELNQPTVSRHLAVLRSVSILSASRQGTEIFYQLSNPKIVEICEMMTEVLAERENQRSEIFHQLVD